MKTDEQKLKEWDELDKKFKHLNHPNIYWDEVSKKKVDIIADDTQDILVRFDAYRDFFSTMYASKGVMDIFSYIKHAKPMVEFLKIKYPKLLGPENNHGISVGEMYPALTEYLEKEKVPFPKSLEKSTFYELFFYLLRHLNLMKEEQVSNQWWWEVLVDKK